MIVGLGVSSDVSKINLNMSCVTFLTTGPHFVSVVHYREPHRAIVLCKRSPTNDWRGEEHINYDAEHTSQISGNDTFRTPISCIYAFFISRSHHSYD